MRWFNNDPAASERIKKFFISHISRLSFSSSTVWNKELCTFTFQIWCIVTRSKTRDKFALSLFVFVDSIQLKVQHWYCSVKMDQKFHLSETLTFPDWVPLPLQSGKDKWWSTSGKGTQNALQLFNSGKCQLFCESSFTFQWHNSAKGGVFHFCFSIRWTNLHFHFFIQLDATLGTG